MNQTKTWRQAMSSPSKTPMQSLLEPWPTTHLLYRLLPLSMREKMLPSKVHLNCWHERYWVNAKFHHTLTCGSQSLFSDNTDVADISEYKLIQI